MMNIPGSFEKISKDPEDGKSKPLSSSPLTFPGSDVSDDSDNSEYFLDISSQLNLPACAANSGADMLEAASVIEKVKSGMSLLAAKASTPNLSRMFLWWNARNEMVSNATGDAGSGTYNRLIMDVASRHGVCSEATWPYDPSKATTRPSIAAYREAFSHRFDDFYNIDTKDDALLSDIVKVLKSTRNVMFGTLVVKPFDSYTTGVVGRPSPTDVRLGRHAMIICGYSSQLKAFLIRNSWGPDWGVNGYGWMSEDYITWAETFGFWVPTKGIW